MSISQIPSGWTITRSDERIVVQHVSGSFYAAAQAGDSGIAESILYMLADSLLSATLSPAHIEDGEEVEVVEFDWPTYLSISNGWPVEVASLVEHLPSEPLMTVAQHQRIVAALASKAAVRVEDEREACERWIRQQIGMPERAAMDWLSHFAKTAWAAWSARAALSAPPASVPAEMTNVRCMCGDEYPHDSYGAGFIAGSGMCENCDAAIPAKEPPAAGVQEEWQPMETAPTDGTLLRLLVEFEDHPIEDGAGPFATVGTNYRDNTGEDAWQIVGWCWEQDRFIDGVGTPVGWLPMLAAPTPPASEQQRAVVMPEFMASADGFAERLYAAGWRAKADAQHSGVRELYNELLRLNPHLDNGEV